MRCVYMYRVNRNMALEHTNTTLARRSYAVANAERKIDGIPDLDANTHESSRCDTGDGSS